MIIQAVLDVILTLLTALLSFLPELPSLPAAVTEAWGSLTSIINQGMSFVGNWLYMPVAIPCLLLVVLAEKFFDIYAFIRWFVSKIPFLNVRM